MATSPKNQPPGPSGQTSTNTMTNTIQFVGACQTKHDNFIDLATSSMNFHCPGWNDSNNPRSHMIPPIFRYKNPHVPNHEVETIRSKLEVIKKTDPSKFDSEHRLVIDFDSDEAERIIFDALYSLTQEPSKFDSDRRSIGPFIAIRDVDCNKDRFDLGKIFPNVDLTHCSPHEYDCVIVAPRVGIVVIEVKGSAFAQDFKPGRTTLSKRLREGFDQLRSFDTSVLYLLNEISGKSVPPSQIRRILFTPNLEKSRFDEWFAREERRMRPSDLDLLKDDGVQWWFKEDLIYGQLVNVDDNLWEPPLYYKLRNYLFETSDVHRLSQDVYELFAPILTGIASVIVKTDQCISVEELILSKPLAVKEQSHRVETGFFMTMFHKMAHHINNARQRAKKKKASQQQQQWLADRKEVTVWKAMVLSPAQLAVLDGPPHQIIVAAAGCGKTILLEAKALELLGKGESVLVVCSNSYAERFKQLFKTHGFNRGLVVRFRETCGSEGVTPHDICQGSLGEELESIMSWGHQTREILEFMGVPAASISEIFDKPDERRRRIKSMSAHNHILIDDAVDDRSEDITEYCRYVCTTASDQQTVWIAMDPILHRANGSSDYKEHIEKLFDIAPSFHHRIVYLTQVMRYPESVFQYVNTIFPIPIDDRDLRPVIGHKIPGLRCQKRIDNLDQLCKEINQVLTDYRDEFSVDQIAIIMGGTKRVINGAKRLTSIFTDIVKNVFAEKFDAEKVVVVFGYVASLEWPLVIYVEDTTEMDDMFTYVRYRSCTRTTGILFHFICDFNKPRSSRASSSYDSKRKRSLSSPPEFVPYHLNRRYSL